MPQVIPRCSVALMRVVPLLVAGLLLAGCAVGGTKTETTTRTLTVTRTVTTSQAPKPGPMRQAENARFFGTPVSITPVDAKRYLLVLKPELFLVGVTANTAFAQQQGSSCAPLQCPSVDNDRLVLPAGSQNLTFVLPAKTEGTVLTLAGGQMRTTTVTAAQLAAIVGGAKTPHLIEPLDSGLWLSVDVDTVTSFAQQYQP